MDNTATTPTFLDNLRAATAQSHTDLEEVSISKSIMNPYVSKDEYILYLSLMRDVVKDAEENIFPELKSVITDLFDRSKKNYLEKDLDALGYSRTTDSKPLSTGLVNPSIAFALGIMYVVEGSSLGGRVILKNINAVLGYDNKNGASYFSGYGDQTGSYWKNFLGMLTQYEGETDSANEIIAGADYAFTAISRHFIANASN